MKYITLLMFDIPIILVFMLMYFFPAKDINSFYGYRTSKSTKNQQSWDFSQYLSSRIMLLLPFGMLIIQAIMLILGININKIIDYSVFELLVGILFLILSVELALSLKQPKAK